MVTFATVTTSAGAELRWLAVSATLGRYERGANQIRAHVRNLIRTMGQTVLPFGTIATAWDNGGDTAYSHGTTISPISRTDVRAVVSVGWQSVERRGSAAGQNGEACRFAGVLSVTLLAPRMTGDGVLRRCADFLMAQLREAEVSEVNFEVPVLIGGGGQVGQGEPQNHALTVEVPFYLDEDNPRATASGTALSGADGYAAVCRTRFRDEIAAARGLVVVHGNAPPPNLGTSEWCALDVIDGGTVRATLPGGFVRYRTTGILQASLYAPLNSGDRELLEIADEFFDAFHAVSDRGVQFQIPAIVQAGRDGQFEAPATVESGRDGPYWRVIVQVPFTAEQIQ